MGTLRMNATTTNTHFFGSDDRPVFRIIIYSLSLAFSVLIASLETVRPTGGNFGFYFEVSWKTALTFLAGAAITVPCFRTIFLSPHKVRRNIALAVVVVIGLVSFLYPLRFVPSDKFGAIFTGLGIAVTVLSLIGAVLFTINRFLNADQRAVEENG